LNPSPAELSVIVPTFNESDNIDEMVGALDACLKDVAWEIIFVDDDSPDGSAERARRLAGCDCRVRCLQRIGRRGLSSAVVEGMLSSAAPYLAVIDGDLQHDETRLPQMLEILKSGQFDIAVGSRYAPGGGIGSWDSSRASISRFAARVSRLLVRADLSDPMSGFFMITRPAFESCMRRLSGLGFKILLDLFASSPQPLRFREIPFQFRTRRAGESKLDNQVAWDYGMLILDKLVGRVLPVRFVTFCLVGGLGVLVHLTVLAILFKISGLAFVAAQTAATFSAMAFNFSLNNLTTYRDMRLRGWRWLIGLTTFTLACSVGAVGNVGIAAYVFSRSVAWIPAALAGIAVGAVWNYAVTMTYTWRK
jgi:dolichol-phosphate mannosyltransferase